MWIDFEGIDGSGKTTVSSRVAEDLRRRGVRVVHAREGGRFASPIAGRVRDLVRSVDSLGLAPEAELLLNLAREAQLVAEVIGPALRQGAWVITDRTTYSHVGLATRVRGLSGEAVEGAAALAAQGLRPDRVFLIDADPDVARWRRRLRKIRERKLGDSGRKGLLGDSLACGMRRALHQDAERRGWGVIDNTWRTLDETVDAVLAALDGRPLPGSNHGFEAEPDDLAASLFRFAGSVDRGLAAMLVAGLDDPRADAIRRGAPRDEAAYSATALDSPGAWSLRDELKGEAPYYVARSTTGVVGDRAWRLRRELLTDVPDQVLHSLRGDPCPEAHALRRRLARDHWEETLWSIRGLDDAPSWGLRDEAPPSAMLAESVARLDTPPAWKLRSELGDAHPLAVLRSLDGVDAPAAWEIRGRLAQAAPKIALATLEGMDVPEAARLRETLRDLAPEETAASLAGVDTPRAWRLREEMWETAPVGVVKSLRGVDQARAERLASVIVRRFPRRLRVAREALQFRMRRP